MLDAAPVFVSDPADLFGGVAGRWVAAAEPNEAVQDFPGCAIVISHDRRFLDTVATHILAFEGESEQAAGGC